MPAVVAGYVGCALVQYHSLLPRLDSALMAAADGTLFAWWVRWLPHAIGEGVNPFVAHAINAPFGVNAMWNTSIPLLAALASPVTLTAGPVVATNLLFVGGPIASAVTAFFVLRRYTEGDFPPFVGGLMFGFSPFIVNIHLHLMWAILPALLVVFLDEILVRQRYSPTRLGVLLGIACVAQMLISTEVLASAAVIGATAMIVTLVDGRRCVRAHLTRAAQSLGAAAVTVLTVGAWPLYVLLFGPQRVSGEIQDAGRYVADLVEFVVPGPHQQIVTPGAVRLYSSFSGNMSEHSAYLGIPLIVLCVVIAARRWDRPIIRVTAITSAIAAVFSLGPRLSIGGVVHESIPLPWAVVQRAPFMSNILPARFSVYVIMGAAFLVAWELSDLLSRRVRWLPVTLVLATLVPLVPVGRHPVPLDNTPAFFTHGAERIRDGSMLVVQPFAHPANAAPMVWQARSGMRFAMPGGYVITQRPGRDPDFWPPSTPLRNVSILLEKGEIPRLTSGLRETLVTELRDLAACALVVGPHRHRAAAVSYFAELLDRPARYEGGMWVFDLEGCGRRTPSPRGARGPF